MYCDGLPPSINLTFKIHDDTTNSFLYGYLNLNIKNKKCQYSAECNVAIIKNI